MVTHLGVAQQQLGRLAESVTSYEKALVLRPDMAEAHANKGGVLRDLGRREESLACYERALALKPNFPEGAHYNRGNVLQELGQLEEALASYGRALELRPGFVQACLNRGGLLEKMGRLDAALADYEEALRVNAEFAEAHYNYGNALRRLGRNEDALASYQRAVELRPGYVAAWNNRGIALHAMGRRTEALASHDRALAFDPSSAEGHTNRGNVLQSLGRLDEALTSHERALAIDPGSAGASYNRGNVLLAMERPEAALASYEMALRLRPDYAAALNNRGSVLHLLGRLTDALDSFDRAVQVDPGLAAAWNNRGNLLQELKRPDEALDCYERALAIDPRREFCFGASLHTKMKLCEWDGMDANLAQLFARIEAGEKVAMPFPVLALTGSLSLQRDAARTWIESKCPAELALPVTVVSERRGKIRVGYYSADFHDHATSYLIAELFELHDRSRFEIFAFSFGPDRDDSMRKRIRASSDRFYDVRRSSDTEIALQSRDLGIDIAIDLKGHTQDSRFGIFARRAAPIQVSYLGYPGTSGAQYIDYLIADRTVISTECRHLYTERIAYLPHSYQVNDRKRVIAERHFARHELGLPQSGFVFCCFNNSYKITPGAFEGWMRILRQVEGSVLWLLEDNATATRNLRREALNRKVDDGRLVFSQRMPLADHLARHRAADLFLDTLPYNAHTTASDALWAGLPVLTCLGTAFAGRVAASLLNAIGLSDLVTTTTEQYETLAVALARDRMRLERVRRNLLENRLVMPLFDTAMFTRHIEDAYVQMSERLRTGRLPADIEVEAR